MVQPVFVRISSIDLNQYAIFTLINFVVKTGEVVGFFKFLVFPYGNG